VVKKSTRFLSSSSGLILLVLPLLVVGLVLIVICAKKFSYFKTGEDIPLPKIEPVGDYIQEERVDLDQDKIKEAVAIYYHQPDEKNFNEAFLVIYKLKNKQWTKFKEQRLGSFTFFKDESSPLAWLGLMYKLTLGDLTGDGSLDVLAEGRDEGSGAYLYAYVYGLKNGQIEQLWYVESITKGKVGLEKDKLWFIMPNYLGSEPNCCPSQWTKSWWTWQGESFKTIKEVKDASLEKVQATPFE
jgi:hypothetical protein